MSTTSVEALMFDTWRRFWMAQHWFWALFIQRTATKSPALHLRMQQDYAKPKNTRPRSLRLFKTPTLRLFSKDLDFFRKRTLSHQDSRTGSNGVRAPGSWQGASGCLSVFSDSSAARATMQCESSCQSHPDCQRGRLASSSMQSNSSRLGGVLCALILSKRMFWVLKWWLCMVMQEVLVRSFNKMACYVRNHYLATGPWK